MKKKETSFINHQTQGGGNESRIRKQRQISIVERREEGASYEGMKK